MNKPKIPQCIVCGKKLIAYLYRSNPPPNIVTADGLPPNRGGQGDNLLCSVGCGYKLAMHIVTAVPGILDLIHPDFRKDNKPAPEDSPDIKAARAAKAATRREFAESVSAEPSPVEIRACRFCGRGIPVEIRRGIGFGRITCGPCSDRHLQDKSHPNGPKGV